jgi:hydrogenase expression/formation protein HypD
VKYLAEYRDPDLARALIARIRTAATRRWVLMEVCGGQTHTIVRQGIDELIADQVEMIHGPGCPVCVTPLEQIDRALAVASRPDVIFTSFGDMLRVPGSHTDLFQVRARGGDVRIVYSPLDAVELARRHPGPRGGVLRGRLRDHGTRQRHGGLACAPAGARELLGPRVPCDRAARDDRHPRVAGQPRTGVPRGGPRVHGHGLGGVRAARRHYRVPIVVTGFEPVDILEGITMAVTQLEAGRHAVENQYVRVRPARRQPAAQ